MQQRRNKMFAFLTSVSLAPEQVLSRLQRIAMEFKGTLASRVDWRSRIFSKGKNIREPDNEMVNPIFAHITPIAIG